MNKPMAIVCWSSSRTVCPKRKKNLYELLSIFNNNAQRIFYFLFDDTQLVLLSGFTKKAQKTPPGAIQKAKGYKKAHLRRYSK
jgi:phage-related protein